VSDYWVTVPPVDKDAEIERLRAENAEMLAALQHIHIEYGNPLPDKWLPRDDK